jgi:hypothetical protein
MVAATNPLMRLAIWPWTSPTDGSGTQNVAQRAFGPHDEILRARNVLRRVADQAEYLGVRDRHDHQRENHEPPEQSGVDDRNGGRPRHPSLQLLDQRVRAERDERRDQKQRDRARDPGGEQQCRDDGDDDDHRDDRAAEYDRRHSAFVIMRRSVTNPARS